MANRFKDIVFSVDTLAELALSSGTTTGQLVKVLGSNTVNDGLGGEYRCVLGDNTAADGFNVVTGPNCRWFRLTSTASNASNAAAAGVGVGLIFRDKTSVVLNLRSIVAGDGIAVEQTTNNIKISATSTASATPIHVYVATTGNDANPGTIASPKATPAGAWSLVPSTLNGPFVVHFASGSYAWSDTPKSQQRGSGSFVLIAGDGASQPSDTGATVVTSGSVSSNSLVGWEILTTGLTADALVGCTFEVLTGVCAGIKRSIVANTTTTISLAGHTSTVADPLVAVLMTSGDTWRVTRPAVKFTSGGNANSSRLLIHMYNVAFTQTVASVSLNETSLWWGVEAGNVSVASRSALAAGNAISSSISSLISGATLGVGSAYQWGIQWPEAGRVSLHAQRMSVFNGSVSIRDGRFLNYGYSNITGGRLSRLQVIEGEVSAGPGSDFQIPLLMTPSETVDGVEVRDRAKLEFVSPVSIVSTASAVDSLFRASGHGAILLGKVNIKLNATTTNVFSALHCSSICVAIEYDTPSVTFDLTGSPNVALFYVNKQSKLDLGGTITLVQSNAVSVLYDTSAVRADRLTLTTTSTTNPAIECKAGSFLHFGAWGAPVLDSVLTSAGTSVLRIEQGAKVVSNVSARLTCTNNGTGTGRDAIRCQGELSCWNVPNTSSTGSSGYGVNARGGGRVGIGAAQPTGVTGPTADFTVGTSVGDDFNDDALSAAYSSKASGGSIVMRTDS